MKRKTDADSILNQYKSIYKELKTYTDEFNSLNGAIEQMDQKHKGELAKTEEIIQESLDVNTKRETQIRAYMNIAKAHTNQLVNAKYPIFFDSGKLARLSVQINNASKNDPYAIQLYTEATGQLAYISQGAERIKNEVSDKKKSLTNGYIVKKNSIVHKINSLLQKANDFFYSVGFVNFITMIHNDKVIYNGNYTDQSYIDGTLDQISIGTIRVPLPVPHLLKKNLVIATKGLFDGETGTIGIPIHLDFSAGSVVIAGYSNHNEHIMLRGIQNLLLNYIRVHSGYDQITFIDPIRFNGSSLGCLSPFSTGKNSIIGPVPVTVEDIKKKIKDILSDINEDTKRRAEDATYNTVKRMIVFHNFPHGYDSALVSRIQQICVNAAYYRTFIVLTNNISSSGTISTDVLNFLKTKALSITSNVTTFNFPIGKPNGNSPFEWYQAPPSLPETLLNRFQDTRPSVDRSNVYESIIDLTNPPIYAKGVRQITNIPFGLDSNGNLLTLDFENSNFATFICGAARSGKSTLLHTIITGIIKDNHPDDVELWLIDFKMTEFSRYMDHLPPHIRYILLDESPELVYDIIDRLSEILMKRQNMFKGKWTKLSEVPPDKYMPVIFVIIDEFSVMSQIIAESITAGQDNYVLKLQTLLAKGAALGLRFIFASQGFTSGTRGLNDFSKKQVQQRIAMKTEFAEIRATLDLVSASDDDRVMMEQLSVHYALLKVPVDERGNHLILTKVLYISDYILQEKFIDQICKQVYSAPRYDVSNTNTYIDKKPMIIDGNNYYPFSAKKTQIKKYISEFDDEFALFVGEPRRMLTLYPIDVNNSFCENFMIVAPPAEKMALSSILLSMIESLKMQNVNVEFWSTKKHPVYRQVLMESKTSATAYTGLDDICGQIGRIKNCILSKAEGNQFFILLGFESLILDMGYLPKESSLPASLKSSDMKIVSSQYEKRGADEPDLMQLMAMGDSGHQSELMTARTTKTPMDNVKAAYDAREDLKFILTHGPKLGFHFIVAFNTAGEINLCKLDHSLFRHKILFRIPKTEAMMLVGAAASGVIAELEDRSFRYTNGLDSISFRPYLHPGLYWDGWQMSGNTVVNTIDEEEEYLL